MEHRIGEKVKKRYLVFCKDEEEEGVFLVPTGCEIPCPVVAEIFINAEELVVDQELLDSWLQFMDTCQDLGDFFYNFIEMIFKAGMAFAEQPNNLKPKKQEVNQCVVSQCMLLK